MKAEMKEQITEEFNRNIAEYFNVAQDQRNEIMRSFLYFNCHTLDQTDPNTGLPIKLKRNTNISVLPAIIKAVAGSEAMEARTLDIVPIDDDQYDIEADIMDDAVSFAQHKSGWKDAYDLAKRDTAICGIGATVSYLDMSKKKAISGYPVCKRVHPSYLFYDTSGCGQDLNDTAKWCGYVDPMHIRDLHEYVEEKTGKKVETPDVTDSLFSVQFLDFNRNQHNIDLLYHYFFRKRERAYDVKNPMFSDEVFQEVVGPDPVALEILAGWADETGVDTQAPYWTLDKHEFSELRETMEAIQRHTKEVFEIEFSTRSVECIYRAEFALGQCLEYSKCYSQDEYPLNFMTGYFDEYKGVFYGFARPLSFVQDALNIAMDDLLDYSHTAPTGGKAWIKGAADDIKLIRDSKANEDPLTPIPRDAELIPKQLASSPQILIETVKLLIDLMPRSIGIGQEFLSVLTTGKMTDSLFGRIIRQSFAVLQDFSSSSANNSKRQGQLFIDMMLSVAKVEDGRILPMLSPGYKEKDYIRLTKQNLATNYVVRVMERPVTEDERMENNKIFMQILDKAQGAGLNLIPSIIENLRIDQGKKDELIELATPKPQQPDPMDVESIQANIRLLNAQAMKLEADAEEKRTTMPHKEDEIRSEISENAASAAEKFTKADLISTENIMKMVQTMTGGEHDRRASIRQ